MALSDVELLKHLSVLKIQDDISQVTKRDVNIEFQKLAKILHPDKSQDSSTTAAFQELRSSFDKLTEHFREKGNVRNDCTPYTDEEMFFADNFHQFNFPYENSGSFTVVIQDFLADTWQACLPCVSHTWHTMLHHLKMNYKST